MFAQTYRSEGVPMTTLAGTDYPAAFTHPRLEYDALTGNVALLDLTHWGAFRLTGKDRLTFLNNMITNDVDKLAVGQGCHAAMTTIKGKLVAELFVLKRETELFILVAQGSTQAVIASLDKHIIADDVTIEDVSKTTGVLSAEGPKSRELVWRLFPDGPLPMEPLAFGDTDYHGMPVTVLRNSASGERGFQLIVGAEHIERIREYLVQAGRGIDMVLAGAVAWNIRRVENGLPCFGPDVGDDNFPKESRLDHLVNYDKGCYLGQETLARMHFRGHPNQLLVGLAPQSGFELPACLEADTASLPTVSSDAAAVGEHIAALTPAGAITGEQNIFLAGDKDDDKPVGRVTSAVFSPKLGRPLLLGYVRLKTLEAGDAIVLHRGNESLPLDVVTLPLEQDAS